MPDMTLERKHGKLTAGCDEAGRGSWAGPIVAAAVILPENILLPGVDDSKKVNKKDHRKLAELILKKAVSVGIGVAGNDFIDQKGIQYANRYVIQKAVEDLNICPHFLLIDGGPQQRIDIDIPQEEIPKGDQKSLSIAAASIIAKAVHDELMKQYAEEFPQYHWEHNAGYGSMDHRYAMNQCGPCKYHRFSFKPVMDAAYRQIPEFKKLYEEGLL